MERFSQLYLARGEPTRDSARFRGRLDACFTTNVANQHSDAFRQAYEAETGMSIPWRNGYWSYSDVWQKGELRDVLDAITITYHVLQAAVHRLHYLKFGPVEWLGFVSRVMHEENMGYVVDTKGVVHYHIDQEFERNRVSTLAQLGQPALRAVRHEFEAAYAYMDGQPPQTKPAVRAMFEAVETMAKLIVPTADRLTKNLCVQKLKDECLAAGGADDVQAQATTHLLTSMGHWVEALHVYRHGQRAEEPVAPDEATAVLMLSEGAAFLRHLAYCARRKGI